MHLDLRKSQKLDKKINVLYNEISYQNINLFNSLIENAYLQYNSNLDWIFSKASNRNPLNSNLFHNFVSVLLIDYFINKRISIDSVTVDSTGLYLLIKHHFSNEIKIIKKIKPNYKKRVRVYLYRFKQITLKFYRFFIYKIINIFYKLTINTNEIILIDTFTLKEYINSDRYYGGLFDDSLNYKEKIYFIPTILDIGFKNALKFYIELKKSNRRYILKEDFISFQDLLFAILHIFRIKKIKFKCILINNIDFSFILNDDLSFYNNNPNLAFESFESYLFIKKLKKNGYKISTFINWWENQPHDKAYNLALNKYFQSTNITGYIGFAPRNFDFHLFPNAFESKLNLIPKRIGVIGKGYIKMIKKFDQNLEVFSAPSFRFNHIFQYSKKFDNSEKKIILVGLPISKLKSINLLKAIPLNLDSYFEKYDIQLLIKPHPASKIDEIMKYSNHLNFKNLKFITGNTYDTLKDADVLISSMSSICMESISMNIPCIVYDESIGIEYRPIPEEIDQEIWNICKNQNEILNSLNYFLNRNIATLNKHRKISNYIKNYYFCESNLNSISNFLKPN